MDKVIAVYGSFGDGNAGDEAVPEALHDMGEELGINLTVKVLTRLERPALPDVIGMGSQYLHQRNAVEGERLFISGGGVIEPFVYSCLYRSSSAVRSFGRSHSTVFAGSVEPGVVYNLRNRVKIALALLGLGVIYTRDLQSERTLNEVLPFVKTRTIGDCVLWMKPKASDLVNSLDLPKDYISCVLAPRWANDQDWLNWISTELVSLSRSAGLDIIFVPMSSVLDDDRNEHARVLNRIRDISPDTVCRSIATPLLPREVSYIISKSCLTVSMRLHGCVMAYAQRTPFVAIGYHPKIAGFCETVDCRSSMLQELGPSTQDYGCYGFRFGSLKLRSGDLPRASDIAIKRTNYSRLTELKQDSLAVFRGLLKDAPC
jgi:polysaccharide pyruvyl transferase WcaK-like protein